MAPIIDAAERARFILIGEASHGTHDFYRLRADITRRLVDRYDVAAVAVEADWPDAYRVNQFVRGASGISDARDALAAFERFPRWMWRNTDVLEFVTWLRTYNDALPAKDRTGFYGIDLYSLRTSMHAIVRYLDTVDPPAAARARERYACFDRFGDDPQQYGHAAALGLTHTCEDDVVAQLVDLLRSSPTIDEREPHDADAHFAAQQNARLVVRAEEYYRTTLHGNIESWNVRDTHMAETLAALDEHLTRERSDAKIVVWAHNSHLGDARATELGAYGELNVGQLVRESHPTETLSVGFSTYAGTVTAAHTWDGPSELMRLSPGLPGSYEALFHAIGEPQLVLDVQANADELAPYEPLLQRAIGVIYRPMTERLSHYFGAHVTKQFDFVIHCDDTSGVTPLV